MFPVSMARICSRVRLPIKATIHCIETYLKCHLLKGLMELPRQLGIKIKDALDRAQNCIMATKFRKLSLTLEVQLITEEESKNSSWMLSVLSFVDFPCGMEGFMDTFQENGQAESRSFVINLLQHSICLSYWSHLSQNITGKLLFQSIIGCLHLSVSSALITDSR